MRYDNKREEIYVSTDVEAGFDKMPHTHVALDDAKEQGALFCNMLRVMKSR